MTGRALVVYESPGCPVLRCAAPRVGYGSSGLRHAQRPESFYVARAVVPRRARTCARWGEELGRTLTVATA